MASSLKLTDQRDMDRPKYTRYQHGIEESTNEDPESRRVERARLERDFMAELPEAVTLEDMWAIPKYTPYVHADLTDEAVSEAEKKLGVNLPELFIAMLKVQNGGYLRKSCEEGFPFLYGIGDDVHKPSICNEVIWDRWRQLQTRIDAEENVDDYDEEWPPEEWSKLIPISGDGTHYFFCLDYRRGGPTEEPRVTYLDIELQSDSEIAITFKALLQRFKIAGSGGETEDVSHKQTVTAVLIVLLGIVIYNLIDSLRR